jgi:hypothetical protein
VERLLRLAGLNQYFSQIHSMPESRVSKFDFLKKLCHRQLGPVAKEPFLKPRLTGKSDTRSTVPVDVEKVEKVEDVEEEQFGSDNGEEVGSDNGEEVGSDNGEEVGSDNGEEVGSDNGEEVGSDNGEEVGSDNGEEVGSDNDAFVLKGADFCIYLDDDQEFYERVNKECNMITFQLKTPKEKFHLQDPVTGRRFQDGSENFTIELMQELETLVSEIHLEMVVYLRGVADSADVSQFDFVKRVRKR